MLNRLFLKHSLLRLYLGFKDEFLEVYNKA